MNDLNPSVSAQYIDATHPGTQNYNRSQNVYRIGTRFESTHDMRIGNHPNVL